jgi:predicted Zn-dependent protease
VAGAFLVGSCRELLRSIDGVGSDGRIDLGAGSCIKDDQIVPVGQAAPTLRVAKVRVLPGVGP